MKGKRACSVWGFRLSGRPTLFFSCFYWMSWRARSLHPWRGGGRFGAPLLTKSATRSLQCTFGDDPSRRKKNLCPFLRGHHIVPIVCAFLRGQRVSFFPKRSAFPSCGIAAPNGPEGTSRERYKEYTKDANFSDVEWNASENSEYVHLSCAVRTPAKSRGGMNKGNTPLPDVARTSRLHHATLRFCFPRCGENADPIAASR